MNSRRLRELLTAETTELAEIVQMIGLDPALTFQVIWMTNSVLVDLDLTDETDHWEVTPVKLTLAGVTETDLEECTARAHAHYVLLCATAG